MAINQSGELANTKGKEEPIGRGGAVLSVQSQDGYKQSCGSSVLSTGGCGTGGPLASGFLALAGPEEMEAWPHEQGIVHQDCLSAPLVNNHYFSGECQNAEERKMPVWPCV